jgi:hypothetical protein
MLDQITSASTYCYDCEKPLAATKTRTAEEGGSQSINTTVFSARVEVDIVSISAVGAARAEAVSPSQVRGALRELVKGVRQEVHELLRDESIDAETKQEARKLFRDFRREVQAAFKEFRRTAEEGGAATTLDNAVLEGFYRFKYDLRAALAPPQPSPSPAPTAEPSEGTIAPAVVEPSGGAETPAPAIAPVVTPATEDPAAPVQSGGPSAAAEVVVPVPQATDPTVVEPPAEEPAPEVDPIGEKIYNIVATFERAYYAFKDQLTAFVNSLRPSEPDPGPADPLPNETPATPSDPSTEPSAEETTSTVFAYTRTSISVEFGSSSFTLAA